MPAPRPDQPIHWRARPALLLAACLAGGIAIAYHGPGIAAPVWFGIGVGAVLVGLGTVLLARRRLVSLRPLAFTCCVGIAVTAAGGLRLTTEAQRPPHHVAHLAARAGDLPLDLLGRIDEAPTVTERGVRFTMTAEAAAWGSGPIALTGRVQVALWQPWAEDAPRVVYPDLVVGDRVRVTGTLRPLSGRRNPADFDYGAWLARRGVGATLAGYDTSAVAVLAHAAGPVERIVHRAQERVRGALRTHVRDDRARGVLQALLLADRSGIATETREAFATTGLMHLLAVSGLHVLLVGMVLWKVLKPLLGRLRWPWRRVEVVRAALTLALLTLYVLVTGAPASAVRALVMAALLIVGAAAERAPNPLNALGVAALVLLLARPTALFDAGFQLSFAAVGGIVLLMPVLERAVPAWWTAGAFRKWTTSSVLVSLAATLGTMPVLLYHFGRLPLAGLVLNLPAIPLTAGTLTGGLLTVACAGWAAPVANLAGAAADLFARLLLWTSETGADWLAWSNVGGYVRDALWLAALVAGLAALALWPRPRHRWRTVALTLGLAAAGVWLPILRGEARPALEVWFLDVGQGDAALVRLPNGRHLLVDAGPRSPYTDAGARTVLPHLRYLGIDRLEAVVVTHPHADHLGGVPAVLKEIDVTQVIHNGHNYASSLHDMTLRLLTERAVRSRAVAAGDTLALDPSVRIQVLYPDRAPDPDTPANDGSVVLRLTYGRTSFLLTGDLEAPGEADLLRAYPGLLRSDVVKVGHHGSRTSSTPALVAATAAPLAVVSVAERNVYGLPDEDVLARWDSAGATILQTSREGAVWLRSDGETVRRLRWR